MENKQTIVYKPLTRESMEEALKGLFKPSSPFKAYTGDGKGGWCSLEDSPQFQQALNEEVKRILDNESKD